MKRVLFIALFVGAILVSSNVAAQNLKIGHINFEELVSLMPEKDSADLALQKYGREIQETIEIMQVEYNNKLNDYQQNINKLTELMRQAKEQELMDLQRRLQEFQYAAQQNYQKKQMELFQPVTEKAEKAIKDVAKENNFTYIIYNNALLYHADNSNDILPLVKTKLNLK